MMVLLLPLLIFAVLLCAAVAAFFLIPSVKLAIVVALALFGAAILVVQFTSGREFH